MSDGVSATGSFRLPHALACARPRLPAAPAPVSSVRLAPVRFARWIALCIAFGVASCAASCAALCAAFCAAFCAAVPAHAAGASADTPLQAPAAARLPREALARLPLLTQVRLSPDGQRLAAVLQQAGQAVLITRPVSGGATSVLLQVDNKSATFGWVRWLNAERLLVGIHYPVTRQRQGVAWDTIETRLAAVRHDGTGLVNVVQPRHRGDDELRRAEQQDQVLDVFEDGRHVLMLLPDNEKSDWASVYRVDTETGARTLWAASESHVGRWFADRRHVVRIGERTRPDGSVEILERSAHDQPLRVLWRFDAFDDQRPVPLGFGNDPDLLYVSARRGGHRGVYTVRLSDPQLRLEPRLVLADRDVSGELVRSQVSGEPIGVRQAFDDGASMLWWEPGITALSAGVDQALPGHANLMDSWLDQAGVFVVRSVGNGDPARYFVGDIATGAMRLLADTAPQLPRARLPHKVVRDILSRDGLRLRTYLSLPPGHAGGRLPLVLLPHGGPHLRDDLFYDAWSALLANEGYAVLQVNYRGSTDRDFAFMRAGFRQWGLKMQDDLDDALDEAVRSGHADASRVCIVGGCYGGYAALVGGIRDPGRFRCVVAFAPVSDLVALTDEAHFGISEFDARANDIRIGSRVADLERLKATSPRFQAARMGPPVLLVHGTNDRRVPVAQGRWMADALKDAGKDVRYIEQEGGDHFLSNQALREQFFNETAAFLALHLQSPAR